MKVLNVIGISPGIAIGPVFKYESREIVIEQGSCVEPEEEVARFHLALEIAVEQLQLIYQKALESTSQHDADIFEAHLMILEDPEIMEKVQKYITESLLSVEYAWYKTILEYEELIASLGDEYLSERSADIRDVGQRVLRILLNRSTEVEISKPSIIVAEDLTPSDTIGFGKSKVLAFCTVKGGPTSHVAILSKALGIPAVVGIGPWLDEFKEGHDLIVDGTGGTVILDPDDFMVQKFANRSLVYKEKFQEAFLKTKLPARTKDGHQVEVVANIGSPQDASEALEFGAEGVGLLRTEFLFLDRDIAPSEGEQVEVYRKILEHFGSQPVVVRTLDIGGDKPASYLKISTEMNPFLGLRGTRLALKWEELFRTQIRSLLLAGQGYNLKVMFPMVGSLQEVLAINEHISECKFQIQKNGQTYAENIEFGIMVEVPSAALVADILADHTDFFSIGTNDLTQYTLAADRTNPLVAEYADAFDPSVLRLIHMVIEAAHKKNKWVGLCGELAGDPRAVPVLLGFGLDEFSMNPRSIPFVKQAVRKYSRQEAVEISKHVEKLKTSAEVHDYLETILSERS